MSDADPDVESDPELLARDRAEQLDRLVSRINGLVRDVTELLMRSASREPTERAVCERIVETDPYDAAWIGELDVAADAIVPSTWKGVDAPEGEFAIDVEASHPAAEALETGNVRLSTEAEPWPTPDDAVDAIAAAPLSYGERTYGVLVVGATDADALDDLEATVVEALGWTVSIAIDAARSRRILATDDVVELAFETRDSGFFPVALSAECDCLLSYEGTVYDSDGAAAAFFTTDVDPEVPVASAEETPDVAGAQIVTDDGSGGLVEFDLGYDAFVKELAERGATLRTLRAESGRARIELEAPSAADPRSIADWFLETYPESELLVYRERERPPTTKREFLGELESELTDRQRTALELAYVSGFYDRTRSITGDELAEFMDVSRTTFHQHLRAAERKVIGQFLDGRTDDERIAD